MSYKHPNPNPAGWQQHGQQGAGSMWPPFPPFRFGIPGAQGNGDVRPQQLNMFLNNRVPFEMGMMGPPPIPQKPVNGNMAPNHPMLRPQYPAHMMPHGLRYPPPADVGSSLPQNEVMQLSNGPARTAMPPSNTTFNDKTSFNKMSYGSFNDAQNVSSQTPQGTHGNNWNTNVSDKALTEDSLLESRDIDTNKGVAAHITELLYSPSSQNNSNRMWNTDSKSANAPLNSLQSKHPEMSGAANPQAALTTPQNPSIGLPIDLKNVQPTVFNDLRSNIVDRESTTLEKSMPGTTHGGLPHSESMLPSIGLAQQSAYMDQNTDEASGGGSDKDKPKRRRRKRCGTCIPCRQKEDCGQCYVCRNKGQVNAICKSRKCLLLRKKAPGSEFGSATSEDGSGSSVTNGVPEPSMKLLHDPPPLGMFGLPANTAPHMTSTPSITPEEARNRNAISDDNTMQQPHNVISMPQPPSTAEMLRCLHNKTQEPAHFPLSGSQPTGLAKQQMFLYDKLQMVMNSAKSNSTKSDQQMKHSMAGSSMFPTDAGSFGAPKSERMPWSMLPTNEAQQPMKTSWQKASSKSVSQNTNASFSSGKLHDLYSTFKDDMQKMNERTHVRANGVRVCKLMSKLLELKITDEELKSSQPPKPLAGTWEQFLPDSKFRDGNPLTALERSDSTEPDVDQVPSEGTDTPQIAPREIVSHRTSDPELVNSQGTTSDVEDAAQTMDVQAVDSGFSSSSPADRQSPSPKRFELPPPESAEATEETQISIRPNIGDAYHYANTENAMNAADSLPPRDTRQIVGPDSPFESNVQSSQHSDALSNTNALKTAQSSSTADQQQASEIGEVKQEKMEATSPGADECALDLSSNSASFPRMSDYQASSTAPQTNFNPLQPLNDMTSSLESQKVLNQPMPIGDNGSSGTASINSFISSLTAQMTGQNVVPPSVDNQQQDGQAAKMEQGLEQDAAHLIKHNKIAEPPQCGCVNRPYDENIEGPYYVHLGSANSIKAIRELIEERCGHTGSSIRIEKVKFTTKEGRTSLGCPAAKWIVRRSGVEEKVLVLTKHRAGHYCSTAWLIVAIVVWEGVPSLAANHMYDYLTRTLPVYGYETERRCGTNQPRDCACQGWDMNRKGASFSFGCSWSVYYNGCKFARSHIPRKFKLRDQSFEGVMESKFQALGQHLAPLYKQMAPLSYGAQVRYEGKAGDCRIGFRTGRPFSGCTATVDFCAHQHRDTHNMNNGCTVVVTLTKHRAISKPDDEQLHTLPMYCLEDTDEHGSALGIQQSIANGGLEILNAFTQEQRRRSRPYKKRKKGTETYQSPKVKLAFMESIREKLIRDKQGSSATRDVTALQKPSIPLPQDREAAKQDLFNVHEKLAAAPQPPQRQQFPTQMPQQMHSQAQQQLYSQQMQQPLHPHAQQPGYAPNPNAMSLSGQLTNSQSTANPAVPQLPNNLDPKVGSVNEPANQPRDIAQHVRQHILNAQIQQQQYLQQQEQQQQDQHQQQQENINKSSLSINPSAGEANIEAPSTPTSQTASSSDVVTSQQTAAVCEPKLGDDTPTVSVTDIDETDEQLNPPMPRPPSPEYDDPEGQDVHEENSHLFRDPNVGGVAIALSHGAVLFEVAKRELHATTALRQPDRYNPTRISLVFYQHKRLNFKKHGYQEYQKAEEERQKARKAARAAGIEYIPKGLKYKQKRMQEAALRKARLTPGAEVPQVKFTGIRKKPGRKVGWKQRKQLRFAAYQYMWPQVVNHPRACTTNTTVTNWVKGQCIVTGPYQKWVSLYSLANQRATPRVTAESSRPPISSFTLPSPSSSQPLLAVFNNQSQAQSTITTSNGIKSTSPPALHNVTNAQPLGKYPKLDNYVTSEASEKSADSSSMAEPATASLQQPASTALPMSSSHMTNAMSFAHLLSSKSPILASSLTSNKSPLGQPPIISSLLQSQHPVNVHQRMADQPPVNMPQNGINEPSVNMSQGSFHQPPITVPQGPLNRIPIATPPGAVNHPHANVPQRAFDQQPVTMAPGSLAYPPATMSQGAINQPPATMPQGAINQPPIVIPQGAINQPPAAISQAFDQQPVAMAPRSMTYPPATMPQGAINQPPATMPQRAADQQPVSMSQGGYNQPPINIPQGAYMRPYSTMPHRALKQQPTRIPESVGMPQRAFNQSPVTMPQKVFDQTPSMQQIMAPTGIGGVMPVNASLQDSFPLMQKNPPGKHLARLLTEELNRDELSHNSSTNSKSALSKP